MSDEKSVPQQGLQIYIRNKTIEEIKRLIDTPKDLRPDFDTWFNTFLKNILDEVLAEFHSQIKDLRQEIQIIVKTSKKDIVQH